MTLQVRGRGSRPEWWCTSATGGGRDRVVTGGSAAVAAAENATSTELLPEGRRSRTTQWVVCRCSQGT